MQRNFVALAARAFALAASLLSLTGRAVAQTPAPIETRAVAIAPVAFTTRLAPGELYLLRASGVVEVGGNRHDAEFVGEGAAARDAVGAVDVGIDVGLLQVHPAVGYQAVPDGPGRMKWFGGARADHTYYMLVTGAGRPLTMRLMATGTASPSGAITVALFPLSPPPPTLGPALDVVRVPVVKVTNTTAFATERGRIYVLQASGAGAVGGGGVRLGDAEYMDWGADGKGRNEGEAGADFGIGVDEPEVGTGRGAKYQPRQRWWGPWRADHVYYMLLAGTGKPIALTYHDSGYGDNSKSDALVVKLFPAP
jgi:hypothetical protein